MTGQLVPLNTVSQLIQTRDKSPYAVNARQLNARSCTLINRIRNLNSSGRWGVQRFAVTE